MSELAHHQPGDPAERGHQNENHLWHGELIAGPLYAEARRRRAGTPRSPVEGHELTRTAGSFLGSAR
jgi:hypothetical protein